MKRHIIVVVIVLGVVGLIVGGVWWHLRQNSAPKLLARAHLAMQAGKYERAVELANAFLAKDPKEPWRGMYVVGLCYTRLGRYDDALVPLEKARQQKPDEVSLVMAIADTHALRAMRALASKGIADQPDTLREAVGQLKEAIAILAPELKDAADALEAKPQPEAADKQDAVALGYAIGFNQYWMAVAQRFLGDRLRKEAETAELGGVAAEAAAKRRESDETRAQTAESYQQAIQTLLAVVRRDPTHSRAGEMLVQLCIEQNDKASLEAARQAIMALADPTPVPALMLTMNELQSAGEVPTADRRAQLAKAAASLDEILAKHPDVSRVKVARADVAFMLEDADTVDRLVEEVLKVDSRNRLARLARARSLIMLREKPAAAEADLFALKTEFPKWPEAHYLYAKAAAATGKAELARDAMRTVTELEPNHVEARRFLAAALMEEGFEDQAAEDVRVYYETRPGDADALRLYVKWAVRTGQPGLATQAVEKARKDYGTQLPMMLAIAEGDSALGKHPDARDVLNRLADSKDKATSTDDRLAVASALLLLNRRAEAETVLDEAVAADPDSAAARFAMGRLYSDTDRAMQAIEHFRAAVQREPLRVGYRLALARTLLRCGLVEESAAECKAIREQDPSNGQAVLLDNTIKIIRGEQVDVAKVVAEAGAGARAGLPLAMMYLRNGQPQRAIEICQAELKRTPNSPDVQGVLGQAYLVLGEKDKCLEQWVPLLTSRPDDMTPYVRIASVLSADKKPEEVEGALEKLPGAKPPMVDMAMGWLYKRLGRHDVAAEVYDRLLARPVASADLQGQARLLRAEALAYSGRVDQALVELGRLSTKKEWRRYALFSKARLLASTRQASEAGAILEELAQTALEERDFEMLGRVAEVYVQLKQPEKALANCDDLQDILPQDARSYLLRARVLAAAGRMADTIPWYRKAIKFQPGNLQTYVMLAKVLDSQLKPADALQVLAKLAEFGEAGRAVSLFEQGAMFSRWGLGHKAAEVFEELAKLGYAGDPRVKLGLGQVFAKLGLKDKARAQLNDIPKYVAQYVMAQQMLSALADKPEEQLAILRQLDETGQAQASVFGQQMRVLLQQDRADEAVKLLNAYLEKAPITSLPPPIAETAMLAMLRAGDNQAAADWCERFLKALPSPRGSRLAILTALRAQSGAVKTFLLPEVAKAGLSDALLGLVVALRSGAGADVWNNRIRQLTEEAVKQGAKEPLPPTYDLLIAVATGQVEAADKQVQTFGRSAGVGRDAAAELVAAAKADKAVAAEAAALLCASMAGDTGIPTLGRAWAMDVLKARPKAQWAAAIALRGPEDPALERQVLETLEPKDCLLAQLARARQLGRDGKYKEAAEIYRKAGEIEKDNPDLVLDQAVATEQAGLTQEALALYRQVWEQTKNPVAANNGAYLISLLSPGDKAALAEAEKWTTSAVETQPNVAAFLDTRGWILYLQGRKDEACLALRRAVKGLSESPDVHYHLGLAEAGAGNADMARWHLREAVSIGDGMKTAGKTISPATARIIEAAREALDKTGPPA